MLPKKVWGIVLIIVAVIAILGGLSNYRYAALSEGIISSLVGTDKRTHALIRNEKAYSITSLGVGIILAVIGTMLLSDIPPSRYIVRFDDEELNTDESDDDKSGKWKF